MPRKKRPGRTAICQMSMMKTFDATQMADYRQWLVETQYKDGPTLYYAMMPVNRLVPNSTCSFCDKRFVYVNLYKSEKNEFNTFSIYIRILLR